MKISKQNWVLVVCFLADCAYRVTHKFPDNSINTISANANTDANTNTAATTNIIDGNCNGNIIEPEKETENRKKQQQQQQ